jgi:pullulanase/glycogen debranching enzyme
MTVTEPMTTGRGTAASNVPPMTWKSWHGAPRQSRALLATLLLSRGVPMILAGDELGRTQGGNNNAYCQDNPISWIDWDGADADLTAFTRRLIAVRRAHPSPAGQTSSLLAASSPSARMPSCCSSRRSSERRRPLGDEIVPA